MSVNQGKAFEQNWRKSCPESVLVYRPPDSAQGFDVGASSKLRFSQHSPCDFIMFDGERGTLWALELKTFDGSCSFERRKEEKGTIHLYQVESLKNFALHSRVRSGFLLDFRKTGNTYFLDINEWDALTGAVAKKSFNEGDLLAHAHPVLIEKRKLRVNYRYDVDKFLSDTRTTGREN